MWGGGGCVGELRPLEMICQMGHTARKALQLRDRLKKYLKANEVKYYSLGGGGGGRRFHGHYFTFSKKIGFMLVFTIIE